MNIQFDKICRTCMTESTTLISIGSFDELSPKSNTNKDISLETPSLAFMLSAITSSNITANDKLPRQMCLSCVSEMNQAFAFKQKCQRSQKTLLNLLEQSKAANQHSNAIKCSSQALECQSTKKSVYQCEKCTRKFKTEFDIQSHLCIKRPVISFETINQSDSMGTTKQIKHPAHKSKLNRTEAAVVDFIAENTLKFICNHCNANFSCRRSLNLHVNSQKCLQQTYECDICQKVFIKKRYLIRHMQRMHKMAEQLCGDEADDSPKMSKRRKYCCHLCPKAFTMTSSLKDHLRIHTGERPYLCAICGKGFTQNSNLRQHLMRHNKNKPFKCIKCIANFVSKGELVSHNRTHTGDHPFSCEICHTGFTTSSSLVKHRRIHSGERPYQCDLCPLRFTALGTMKNHRRTHTGEKYHCGVCNKSFSQRTDCVNHLRKHASLDNQLQEGGETNLTLQ